MRATRTFADKASAVRFAKQHGAEVRPLASDNPMRDFGYRWEVDYEITKPEK